MIELMKRIHESGIKESGVSVELAYYGEGEWSIYWAGCNGEDYKRGSLEECAAYAEAAVSNQKGDHVP